MGSERAWRQVARNRWLTTCPFHEDSTASFSVSFVEFGWAFHCFGCQEEGDVIRFVMLTGGCGFMEAIERLGKSEISVPPELWSKAHTHVIPCEIPGCTSTLPVNLEDVPHLGKGLHVDWTFADGPRGRCPTCTLRAVREKRARQE